MIIAHESIITTSGSNAPCWVHILYVCRNLLHSGGFGLFLSVEDSY